MEASDDNVRGVIDTLTKVVEALDRGPASSSSARTRRAMKAGAASA
jgi:hypothetical protein